MKGRLREGKWTEKGREGYGKTEKKEKYEEENNSKRKERRGKRLAEKAVWSK